MHIGDIQVLVGQIKFKDWTFYVGTYMGGPAYLQVQFEAADNDDPEQLTTVQKGRKWLLSGHMTESEIVQTAWLAVQVAMEHELREQFTYKKRPVFGPHFNVNALRLLVDTKAFDVRTPPPAEKAAS